jgi:nucleoside-diphosphate-sugar epimerase
MADITDPASLQTISPGFDWVINTVSSTKGGVEEYRAVYLEGTRHLLDWLSHHRPARYVYTSSTSVYAQTDGAWVTESSPTEPPGETSRVLVAAEQLLLSAAREQGFPSLVLRVAGIYGPGRGQLCQQFLRGEARLSEAGGRLITMIHRDDVVAGILAALKRGVPGSVYNVADDEPVTQIEFFRWLAGQLKRPLPPVATEGEEPARKRGLTHKRVSNRKLRLELGCELKYPTFRQGYAVEMARLRESGLLTDPRG